jgi:nicotinamidase-related amidase
MLESGFEVTVVKDATAGGILPDLGDGYAAAMTNYRFLANAVVTTEEASLALRSAKTG